VGHITWLDLVVDEEVCFRAKVPDNQRHYLLSKDIINYQLSSLFWLTILASCPV
jgi:hypothetical protein